MLKHLPLVTAFTLAIGIGANTASAQALSRATLLPDFNLPDVNIVFDQVLDSNFGRGGSLDANAQLIFNAHRIAQQQVQIAIEYLEQNRALILQGNSAEFNQIFGNPSRSTTNAVLSSRPLTGGELDIDNSDPLNPTFVIEVDGGQMGVSLSAGNNLRPGQQIFVAFDGDGVGGLPPAPGIPNAPSNGFLARIQKITSQDASGETQEIELDPQSIRVSNPTLLTSNNNNNVPVGIWGVVDIVDRIDSTLYDQVLNTYRKIRLALQGFEPNPRNSGRGSAPIQRDIQYIGEYRDFNAVWRPGEATVFPGTNYFGHTPDRRLRQAGFSNSDSLQHIQNLNAQSGNNPPPPLLWTEDNARQLDPNSITGVLPNGNLVGTLLGDESRPFFNNRQTLFSVPNNPNIQYVGRAFLEERIIHAGDFQDDSIAGSGGTLRRVNALDANGNIQIDNNGIVQTTLVNVGESTNATESPTELVRWQMILESFSEFDTNFNDRTTDSAYIGLAQLAGGAGANSSVQVRDATNFARFADLFRGIPGGGQGSGPIQPEPQGKRATAGSSDFNPVIPLF